MRFLSLGLGPTVNEALVPVEGRGRAPLVTVLRASELGAPERRAPERRAPERRAPERRAPERRAPEGRAPEPVPPLALAPEPASSVFAPSPASFSAAAP